MIRLYNVLVDLVNFVNYFVVKSLRNIVGGGLEFLDILDDGRREDDLKQGITFHGSKSEIVIIN